MVFVFDKNIIDVDYIFCVLWVWLCFFFIIDFIVVLFVVKVRNMCDFCYFVNGFMFLILIKI